MARGRRGLGLALGLGLAACQGAPARGPAWPKSAGTVVPASSQDDGGESLEPRAAGSHVAAIEVAADPTPAATAAAPTVEVTIDPGTPTSTEKPPSPVTETIDIQVEDIPVGPGDIIIAP